MCARVCVWRVCVCEGYSMSCMWTPFMFVFRMVGFINTSSGHLPFGKAVEWWEGV